MKRAAPPVQRKRAKVYEGPDEPDFDVVLANDPPWAYYGLVLSVDEAVGRLANDAQVHLSFDAASVQWYQALNLFAVPPLDQVAVLSDCCLLEVVLDAQNYVNYDAQLVALHGTGLRESTWWLIDPAPYALRGVVRVEQFLPPPLDVNPANVATSASRHEQFNVLNRLIVPRHLFRVRLFSLRELF